jgi:TonB-linked SusC/RagA family outer membrane protein
MSKFKNIKPLRYLWISRIHCVLLIVIVNMSIFADVAFAQQQITVRGQVVDEFGESLPAATVVIEGTTQGTTTDVDGNYTINVANNGVLLISFIGYESQRIPVAGRDRIDVILRASQLMLDEAVVVGYGTTSRRLLTTSVSSVRADQFESIPISGVAEGLKGKVSGVRIYDLSGFPGQEPVIRIRGGSSIGRSNEPLILVDGVERPLSDINPNDIGEITILKDAASTAIYGSRASNGVLLVTTKRGQRGAASNITFESNMGFQERIQDRELMNAEEYIVFARSKTHPNHPSYNIMINGDESSFSSGNTETSRYTTRYLQPGEAVPAGWKSVQDPIDPSRTLIFQDTDYQDLMFGRALWQSHNLVASGGSDQITYRASVGYSDDQGIALSSGWKRLSARANTDIRVRDNVTFSSDFSYMHSDTEQFGNQMQGLGRGTYGTPPTQRPRWDDGTPTPGYNYTAPNPLYLDYVNESDNTESYLDIGGRLSFLLGERLRANVDVRHHVYNRELSQFERAHVFRGARAASFSTWNRNRSQLDGNMTYSQNLGRHSVSTMGGFSMNLTNFTTSLAEASGAATDKIYTLNVAPDLNNISTNITEEALVGFFGRVTYDYDQKYLLTAVFRADGSSRFSPENRWGYFPGVSAAWIISEESFLQNLRFLSFFKLRSSYGLTGNNSVGLYDAFGVYNLAQSYAGNAGIRATVMPNPDLSWESTKQLDLGLDANFLNNRIMLSVDYFDKLTSQLLFTVPLPNTSGFNNIIQNVGEVRFYGYEFEISSINMRRQNFTWTSNFNWSYVQNEVVRLPDNGRPGNRIGGFTDANGNAFGGIAQGEPLGRFYGYKVAFIIETQEQADQANFDQLSQGWDPRDGTRRSGRKKIGDYEWVDRDGDGRITAADQFLLGNEIPHTTLGLTNNFKYKNWSANIVMDMALGHSIHDRTYNWNFMHVFDGNFALSRELFKAWEKPGDKTKYAAFHPNDNQLSKNYDRESDVFTYKADFLAIREISIGYDFNRDIAALLGGRAISVYGSVYNLHYFTKVKGLTPERGTSNTRTDDAGTQGYPMVRRVTFGVKFSF